MAPRDIHPERTQAVLQLREIDETLRVMRAAGDPAHDIQQLLDVRDITVKRVRELGAAPWHWSPAGDNSWLVPERKESVAS